MDKALAEKKTLLLKNEKKLPIQKKMDQTILISFCDC